MTKKNAQKSAAKNLPTYIVAEVLGKAVGLAWWDVYQATGFGHVDAAKDRQRRAQQPVREIAALLRHEGTEEEAAAFEKAVDIAADLAYQNCKNRHNG